MISASDILHGKVLIVDDQEANALLLERILHGAGYVSITSTMDPCEVCELHRNNRYDLILLDLEMPNMDGYQVMEGLKEIEPGDYLPVLVVTAHAGHKLRALQAGAKGFISELAIMLGLDEAFVDKIFLASPMHDIGKMASPTIFCSSRAASRGMSERS